MDMTHRLIYGHSRSRMRIGIRFRAGNVWLQSVVITGGPFAVAAFVCALSQNGMIML